MDRVSRAENGGSSWAKPAQGDAQPDSARATGTASVRITCLTTVGFPAVVVQKPRFQGHSAGGKPESLASLKLQTSVQHNVVVASELRSELDLSAAVAQAASSTQNQTA